MIDRGAQESIDAIQKTVMQLVNERDRLSFTIDQCLELWAEKVCPFKPGDTVPTRKLLNDLLRVESVKASPTYSGQFPFEWVVEGHYLKGGKVGPRAGHLSEREWSSGAERRAKSTDATEA